MEFTRLASAEDKSVNFIHRTPDGGAFEARFVQREPHYVIAYLSSHSGCDRACRMCHLTQTGQTTMAPASLTDYIEQARAVLQHYADSPGPRAVFVNFNFMARGEPFMNPVVLHRWEELRTSLQMLAEQYSLRARFNLSTIYPRALNGRELVDILGGRAASTTVYYSLYSVDPRFRSRWLPKAARPFDALSALRQWQKATGGDVVLHWAFIEGENDSEQDVEQICNAILVSGLNCRFNLVRYNPYSPAQGAEPSEATIVRLFGRLASFTDPGSRIVPRVGFDVKASCGMFVETGKLRTKSGKAPKAKASDIVLRLIEQAPRTCYEIEQITGLSHQTASARLHELRLAGRIFPSAARRPTASGRTAQVWRLGTPDDILLMRQQQGDVAVPKDDRRKLTIDREGDGFVVDDLTLPGSPPVGRGRTMQEAMGDWLIKNQHQLGLRFDLTPAAQPAEVARRLEAEAAR